MSEPAEDCFLDRLHLKYTFRRMLRTVAVSDYSSTSLSVLLSSPVHRLARAVCMKELAAGSSPKGRAVMY